MRRFLVITTQQKINEEPHIYAKILVAALLISNGVRQDAEAVYHLVDQRKTVKIIGARVKRLFPDEESSVGFLRKAVAGEKLPGVVVRRDQGDLVVGMALGPSGRGRCAPRTPFTYILKFVEYDVEPECGLGLEKIPPHHQVVIVNIEVDRALRRGLHL